MNPFRRWFGPRPPANSPPTPTSSPVPPGQEVKACVVPLSVDPAPYPLEGGVHVIFLGRGSDEPVEELDRLLRELEPQLATPRPPVRLALEAGPISELFAPTPPPLRVVPRFLLWLFTRQGLEDWLETPARLRALLRAIHRLRHATEPLTQCAYFEHDSGPGAAVMARLLAGLGLYICEAEPDPERLFLLEAHRPDATIITKLMGRPFPLPGAADTVLATVYAQQAQAQGDATRRRILEQLERDHLCRELQTLPSEPHRLPPLRAPRLCRLLRTAVEQGGPTALKELERELLERARPLPLLMKPDGQCLLVRLPGIGLVLQVYPDLLLMQQAVKELGLAEGSYLAGGIPARDLFAFGAQENLPVVLSLSATAHASQHVRWSPAEARLLAQGQSSTPTASPLLPASPVESGPASELLRGAVFDTTVIGRKSMSLELTAKEQQAAHAADAMMQSLRLMNGNQPYPGLPPGAIPLSELEAGVVGGQMFRIKRALRVGVDPNEQTVQYGTALHAAAHAGTLDIARLLVDYGANPQARDDQGRTPAELARLRKHWDVAAFLDSAAGLSRISTRTLPGASDIG